MNFEDDPFERSEQETPSMGITMAPLVDVVFLLLIFFMVTTTFRLRPGLRIELPRSGGNLEQPDERWIVSLTQERELFLNERNVDPETLESKLESNKKPVIFRADKGVPHGSIVSILDRIRSAGIKSVDVSTRPMDDQ